MRQLAFASLLVLAACSGGEAPDNAAAEQAAKANLQLAVGGWESVSEVTSMSREDEGEPRLKADAGTKTTVQACVAEGEGKRPPAALLAGIEGASCDYQNIYMSRGRLNATMNCKRPDLSGMVLVGVEGTYTDKSFDITSDVRTSLATDGDIRYRAKASGRHTGACATEPVKAG